MESEESILSRAAASLSINNDDDDDSPLVVVESLSSSSSSLSSSNITPSTGAKTATTATTATVTSSTTILNPIYISTSSGNENWELTWPIWHMLPLTERKAIAKQNGFKTIGEFEESVILSRALHQDLSQQQQPQQQPTPYSSDHLYEYENRPQNFGLPIVAERSDIVQSKNDGRNYNYQNENESESVCSSEEDEQDIIMDNHNQNNNNNIKLEEDQDTEHGGLILLLPPDIIIHFILPFLPIDQYATCALVSPHWKNFTRTESVYKELCKRCYLQQSKRKALHVHRFHNSYHTMLTNRFRVKTGCGFYVLKCTKIKKIQRDMWTEVPVGAILESTYYRYIYFFENGTLLYALTSKPPHEMISIFRKMNEQSIHSYASVNGVLGTYEIQKDKVTVNVTHPWHHVRLVLKVLKDGYSGSKGRFWALEFEKHWSSQSGNFNEYWSRDLVEYKIPADPIFRFLRDYRI